MLNKKYCLTFIGVFVISTAMSAPTQPGKNVNIHVNPGGALMISQNQSDMRLKALRDKVNQQNEKTANAENKSFVSHAPDPNDPSYWKDKNNDQPQIINQASKDQDNFVNEQQRQRQTTALKQILTSLRANNSKKSTAHVVVFSESKRQSMMVNTSKARLKSALALPGTVWYATMYSGADSYVPGPVMAQIQEGPFAGGKAVGKFEIAPDGEHLILTFYSLSFNNRSYSISAVAMDPKTKIAGITGNIDHHIFTRFILPGAASFLEDVTHALMNQGQSVVANSSGIVVTSPKLTKTQIALMGVGGATRSFASATRPEGVLRLPEVKIQAGQGIGFLVLKPILQEELLDE